MIQRTNGSPDSAPGLYYNPTYYAQNIRRYRQTHPPGDALLRVEAFDYLLISVLQLTNLSACCLELQAVHVDYAFPLFATVENTPDLFSKAQYPLPFATEASLSLLLNNHITSERFLPFGAPPPKPKKVVVTTSSGLLIFEPEEL
ncbi:MAG: hypothetical protein ACFUZC_23820 [Chthoniobacteraceae bacterium]